jgi:hypothetical protein
VEFIGLLALQGSGVRSSTLFGVIIWDIEVEKLSESCRKSLFKCIFLVEVNKEEF